MEKYKFIFVGITSEELANNLPKGVICIIGTPSPSVEIVIEMDSKDPEVIADLVGTMETKGWVYTP